MGSSNQGYKIKTPCRSFAFPYGLHSFHIIYYKCFYATLKYLSVYYYYSNNITYNIRSLGKLMVNLAQNNGFKSIELLPFVTHSCSLLEYIVLVNVHNDVEFLNMLNTLIKHQLVHFRSDQLTTIHHSIFLQKHLCIH